MRKTFTIKSEEGLPIRGVVEIPDHARALVVIVHGFKGFKDWGFFPWLTEFLADAGIAACRFDLSRNGIGEDGETFDRLDLFADDTYSIEMTDLRDVSDYLDSMDGLGNLPQFLLGHSRGGGIALLGAHQIPRLYGVITWSSIAVTDRWDEAAKRQWRERGFLDVVNARTGQVMRVSTAILDDLENHRKRLDIESAVRDIGVPILVVHGGNDEAVPIEEARRIASWSDDLSLVIIENATHTMNSIHPLVTVPDQLRLAAEMSARFVHAYCGSART